MSHDHINIPLGDSPDRQIDAWYDTRAGLEEALARGLDGLHDIARERREAGYRRGERMAEWCFLGSFYADTCGNFSALTKGAPKDGYPYWKMEEVYDTPTVMTREEMGEFTRRWEATSGPALPPADGKCDRCGDGWSLRNVRDYYQGREQPPRHKGCQELYIVDHERKEFTEILDRSEIPYTEMIAIPNQYYPDPTWYGPWFMVETPKGRIKIGWRKRVISIDWSTSELEAPGSAVVEEERVTHWERGVHAYGADKAVEALRKLWRHA